MTPSRLRYENCCVVHSCLRPVRAAGGYCIAHWMALSPAQRAAIQDDPPTDPIDTLELWLNLPAYEGPRNFGEAA